jgi:hypothetical protein
MQEKHRYTLEPYKGMNTRYRCPNCNKKGVFTKYIDTETSKHLNDAVGYCNRIVKCAYHYTPKDYFQDNNVLFDTTNLVTCVKSQPKPKPNTSFIDVEVMRKSIDIKGTNYFIDYLANLWDYEVAFYLAQRYNIGASKHWHGATVFWQVDQNNKVRTGKIMLYNPENGKRIKKPFNHINWAHSVLKLDNFNLDQCYFGTHLLNEDTAKPVAIVESEKTAVIASVYLPEFIWLACGSVNNLNKEKTKVLEGRDVVLFPDLNCYELWNNKIPKLTKSATFITSTLLRDKASKAEKRQGLDIADFLVKIKT